MFPLNVSKRIDKTNQIKFKYLNHRGNLLNNVKKFINFALLF